MNSWCYILFSKKLNRFYVGISTDLPSRILHHNKHLYGNHRYTAKADDWELFLEIASQNLAHARKMELKIKSMKSSVYIINLIRYPELLNKLIKQTCS